LPIVDMVHVEDVVAVILKKSHEGTLLHLVLYQQVAELVERFEDCFAIGCFPLC
jgi:hypothetical protein